MNKELPAVSTLLHYRIVSKIGAGGMGELQARSLRRQLRIVHDDPRFRSLVWRLTLPE